MYSEKCKEWSDLYSKHLILFACPALMLFVLSLSACLPSWRIIVCKYSHICINRQCTQRVKFYDTTTWLYTRPFNCVSTSIKKKFIHQSHKCIQSSFKRHKTISIPHVLNNPLLDSPSPDNGAGWGWGGGCHLGPHSFFFQSFPRTSSKWNSACTNTMPTFYEKCDH